MNVRSSKDQALPGARAALVLLLSINLVNYIDRYVLAAAVGPIKETFFGAGSGPTTGTLAIIVDWFQNRLGFKPQDALIGLLSTAFMVSYMATAPVFARLAETYSRRALIGIGVILWSLASGASGLAGTFLALLFTRCFVGIGEAAYGPVAPTLISDMYPVNTRGKVLAWFYVAIPSGSALGYVVGSAISQSSLGWRWAFYVVVIPGILLGVASFWMKEPRRGEADKTTSKGAVRFRDYAILWRTPSYVFCSLGMAAMTFATGGIAFWMPYYIETRPGAPKSATIYFGAITAVAGLTATLAGGIAGDKLRARFAGSYLLVSGAAMLIGFPIFLLMLNAPFPWMWALVFVTSFCLFFNTGPSNTVLANVTHPSMRAAGYAINILVIHILGDVGSPFLIGLLNDYFRDMSKSFLVVGLMFVIAGAAWLWGARYLARDTELAPTRLNAASPAH